MPKHKHKWVVFQLYLPEKPGIQKQIPNPDYEELEVLTTTTFSGGGVSPLSGMSFTYGSELLYGQEKYKTVMLPTMVLVCTCGKYKRLIAEEVSETPGLEELKEESDVKKVSKKNT